MSIFLFEPIGFFYNFIYSQSFTIMAYNMKNTKYIKKINIVLIKIKKIISYQLLD